MSRAAWMGLSAVATILLVLTRTRGAPESVPPTAPEVPLAAAERAIEVAAESPHEVSEKLREAFLAGNSVRVEYRASAGRSPDRDYWCRAMSDADKRSALRQLARVHASTNRAFDPPDEHADSVERERHMANQLRIRAMVEAATTLIGEGRAFVTKGPVNALHSDDKWHYWNMRIHTKAEGDLSLNVPIDLDRFPAVRDWRQRESDVNQFAEADAAYRWNGLDYAIRQQIVAGGAQASEKLLVLEREAEGLRAVALDKRTPEQVQRSIALAAEIEACRRAVARVPRAIDPTTLEWPR